MPSERTVQDADGLTSVVFHWPAAIPQATVQILHGWCEHALRYDHLATQLAAAGFTVYADDHRGHGQTGVRSGTLGDLGPRGMTGVVDAVHAVSATIRAEEPGRPFFVLGHSWGSFILQEYLRRWGGEIDGALLTGTTRPGPNAAIDAAVADAPAPRTAYDWLSRDDAEVDAYIADPLCGFEIMADVPASELFTLLEGDDSHIPTSLPVFIFNGADDPVGGETGGRRLFEHYQALGMTDVSFRSYPGARHELCNETNRDEVVTDVLEWLSDHL